MSKSRAGIPRLPVVDPELELLLTLATTEPSACRTSRAVDQARFGINWERFYLLARRHRLTALICKSMGELGIQLPKEVWSKFEEDRKSLAIEAISFTAELLRIQDHFLASGLEIAILKGPVLGASLYGDLGLRPFGDLDVFVRVEEVLAAKEQLVELGYRPDPPMSVRRERSFIEGQSAYEFYHDERGYKIEVHTALAHRRYRYRHDPDAIWARVTDTTIGHRQVKMLGAEDLLVFLCMHGAKHVWWQLVWVSDVAQLVKTHPELRWEQIVAKSKNADCLRMVLLGLLLVHRWLDVDLPEHILAHIERDRQLGKLVQIVLDCAASLETTSKRIEAEVRFQVLARETMQDKWGQVVEKLGDRVRAFFQNFLVHVRPSRVDRDFVHLPHGFGILYFLVRPVRLVYSFLFGNDLDKKSED